MRDLNPTPESSDANPGVTPPWQPRSLDRRAFFGALGFAAVACARKPGQEEEKPAGSVRTSGEQVKPAGTLERIGLQLYTARDDMAKDFDGTLARVAAIGYRDVEFAGYFGRSPAAVRAVLDRNGLKAPSSHVGTAAAVTTDWDKTLDAAREVGHEYLVVAWLTEQERRTLDDYRKLGDVFNTAGEKAKQAGARFAYHNHDFEFVRMDGQLPYDVLLERTDPALVAMELDLFWITKAGHSSLAYFDKHPRRFPLVHVKDMDDSSEQRMVDVGRGAIDFARIFAAREKAGIRHFFVEHDNPKPSALESAKTSYEYLAGLKF